MIIGISIVSVWVLDQDKAKDFYTKQMGFELTNDIQLDNGMRWLTVCPRGTTGKGVRPAQDSLENREEHVYRAAGFDGPQRIELPPRTIERTAEEVRASVYSLSGAAPHLFGVHLDRFDSDLSELLAQAAPDGLFSERLREITIDIWR